MQNVQKKILCHWFLYLISVRSSLGLDFLSFCIFFENLLIFFTRSHEEDDKEDEAVKCYESILNIDPDHKDAKRSIDRIKGLEKDLEELGFKDVDYKFVLHNFFVKSFLRKSWLLISWKKNLHNFLSAPLFFFTQLVSITKSSFFSLYSFIQIHEEKPWNVWKIQSICGIRKGEET